MTLWPANISKYWTDVATTGFNSFVSGSDNCFMGLTTTLLSFQYVYIILNSNITLVMKGFKITSWF